MWFFIGLLFVANASFNNLGFPLLSTLFNWGRATLGTMPFALIGARYGGPEGRDRRDRRRGVPVRQRRHRDRVLDRAPPRGPRHV